MPLEQIPEQEIREILLRAQEIALQPEVGAEEFEAFLKAAEEIGIPREATLQAMRERRLIPVRTMALDELVFAPSDDHHQYVASVLSVSMSSVTVRFITGGERTCALDDVEPISLAPGRKVYYKYPGVGWLSGEICRYEPNTQTVWVTSAWDMEEREVPLSQMRLSPRKSGSPSQVNGLLWRVGLACGTGGALLALLLEHLLR